LRKHKEDIASLLKHFCLKFANRSGIFKTFDDEAQDALLLYNWPGNVRELESVVERGNIVSDSEKILFKDLPDTIKKFYSKRRSASRTENATNHRFPVPAESNGDFNFGQDSEELIKAFVKNGWELQSFLYSIKPLLRLVDVKQFKLKVISIKSKLALMIETCEEDVKAALNFLKCNLNPDNKSYFDPDHELLDQEYLKSAIDFCKGNVQLTSKLLKVLGFEDNVSTGFIKNRLGIDKRNQKKAIDKLSEWYRQKYLS
jgi:DNA-binding NtrC family response regulator